MLRVNLAAQDLSHVRISQKQVCSQFSGEIIVRDIA